MLGREGLGAILLNSQHNFAWLTGGSSNGVDLSRENGVASLLVTNEGKRFLLSNNIEMPRMMAEEVSAEQFEPVEFTWQNEKSFGDTALLKANEIAGEGNIATDIPVFANVPAIENKIAACRYQLTSQEVDRYRELGRDAGTAIMRVINLLEPGESELSVATKMHTEFAAFGLTSVVTLVAADERIAQFRHPVPTRNSWQKTLLMVICAKRGGLIVSLSRLVCLGDVPDELQRRTDAAAFVNAVMLDATMPGALASDIYYKTAEAYACRGFPSEINLHHQGGAAGYKTRDWVIHPRSRETVHLDQAFAWNPSITCTKVEETCITTAEGIEIVTTSPDFPQIAVNLDGKEYFSPGILSL